jgi:hypothetical protein
LLGIKVQQDWEAHTISLSQQSYIELIACCYGLEDLKPISTPMDPNIRLLTSQSSSTVAQYAMMCHIPYHEAVGSSMYTMLEMQPDILFANMVGSKFLSNPGIAHWEAVKRIYQYLVGMNDLWLTYGEEKRVLAGFADADGSMVENRHTISGFVFLFDGSVVSWSTKRQEIVSLLTTEGEYIAATHAAKEALWLCSLITQHFGLLPEATTLFSDNQSAIALTKDHQYHARMRHMDICFHFIHWIIKDGKPRLIYCPTSDMVADTLTKTLLSLKVKHFAAELGLCRA